MENLQDISLPMRTEEEEEECLIYTLTKTTKRLTFDIIFQREDTIFKGEDDGDYFIFTASNGYQVISRSRMDIQTERLWLLGAKHLDEARSGTMVFSSNEARDKAYEEFVKAIDEWASSVRGVAFELMEWLNGY